MSELDAANTAPPASDSERKTALGWTALVIVLGIVAVIVALWYFYQQGKKHDEQVTAIQSAPVVLPPVVKPPIYKRIIKTKEAGVKITTPTSKSQEQIDFESDVKLFNQLNKDRVVIVPQEEKQPLSARELAYENRLNKFDNRLTKGEKP